MRGPFLFRGYTNETERSTIRILGLGKFSVLFCFFLTVGPTEIVVLSALENPEGCSNDSIVEDEGDGALDHSMVQGKSITCFVDLMLSEPSLQFRLVVETYTGTSPV